MRYRHIWRVGETVLTRAVCGSVDRDDPTEELPMCPTCLRRNGARRRTTSIVLNDLEADEVTITLPDGRHLSVTW